MAIKKTKQDIIIEMASICICLIVIIVTVYPLYYCLINSLNTGSDSVSGGIFIFPRKFTLENYKFVFQDNTIITAFVMSVLRALSATVLTVIFNSMMAYSLSRKQLVGRKVYMYFGIITCFFVPGLIPSYLVYKQFALINTFLVYIIPGIMNFFFVILFITFFKELPASLEESATIDGASHFTIYRKLIIPLSKPVVASVSMFTFIWQWNDWTAPAFYITTNDKLLTLPAVLMRSLSMANAQQELMRFFGGSDTGTVTALSVRYATLMVAVLPIIFIYPFAQKYFVKGMMVGSIKE